MQMKGCSISAAAMPRGCVHSTAGDLALLVPLAQANEPKATEADTFGDLVAKALGGHAHPHPHHPQHQPQAQMQQQAEAEEEKPVL